VKEQLIRYRPGIDPKRESRTDWDRVDRMTDDEVEAAALSDPDAQPLTEEQLAECFRPGMLRVARERLGLSQKQFAQRFHIDLRTLRHWEEGRNVPGKAPGAYLQVVKEVLAALED
jgi:putative transcriptional regulator